MTSTSSLSTHPIIIDANVAVWAVLPVIAEIETLDRLQQWHGKHRRILAPDLFIAEAISVFRFLIYRKLISSEEGAQAIDDFFNLEIQTIPITRSLSHAAMSWAAKIQHSRAYDSFYLALAEQEDAWLWTADKRLVNGARQHGFSHIAWIGESETDSVEKLSP